MIVNTEQWVYNRFDDRPLYRETHPRTASVFCVFCDQVIMPDDRIWHWQSCSSHPHITAHASCVAKNKSGLLADIQKCCGE